MNVNVCSVKIEKVKKKNILRERIRRINTLSENYKWLVPRAIGHVYNVSQNCHYWYISWKHCLLFWHGQCFHAESNEKRISCSYSNFVIVMQWRSYVYIAFFYIFNRRIYWHWRLSRYLFNEELIYSTNIHFKHNICQRRPHYEYWFIEAY